jgi:hypothetical protein
MGPHATAFAGLWITFKLKKPRRETKWRHDMSGKHTGPQGDPDASGSEHLHLPGGL